MCIVATCHDSTRQGDSYAGAAAADSLAFGRGAACLSAALRTPTTSTQAVGRRTQRCMPVCYCYACQALEHNATSKHLRFCGVSNTADASDGGSHLYACAGGTRQRSAGPQRAASWQQIRQNSELKVQRGQQSRRGQRRMAPPSPSGRQRSSQKEPVRRPSARLGRRCPSSSVRRAPHAEVHAGFPCMQMQGALAALCNAQP
jgi:hypothetical protein